MKKSRILSSAAAILLGTAIIVIPGSPASAAVTSTCTLGHSNMQNCIFWGQAYNNSKSGVTGHVSNFPVTGTTGYIYKSAGTGQGQYLGNNNGSNRNMDQHCNMALYYDPNYSGPSLGFAPNPSPGYQKAGSGLGQLLNNMRSQSWLC